MCSFHYGSDISGYTEVLYHPKTVLQESKSVLLRVGSQSLYVEFQTKIFIVTMSPYDSDFFRHLQIIRLILKPASSIMHEIGFGKNPDK